MASLNLADTFITFLALAGPQKVLLSFALLARTLDVRTLRLVAAATALTAAVIGTVCALTAPWLATFFHISQGALALASGIVFFIYAVGLVLGLHFDHAEASAPDGEGVEGDADPSHPFRWGFRVMLLPFVVSPLAVAADLEVSLSASDWGARWVVAGAFALVALVDALCAVVFAPVLRRMNESILEVLSRLLGILLAAVGVQLFLHGLETLGVVFHAPH
ncbi:MAG TPA: MarC family protein [Trebonia sp.]|nr:MarC family protein [Trebonia sp.]